jgi:hypothetical protein
LTAWRRCTCHHTEGMDQIWPTNENNVPKRMKFTVNSRPDMEIMSAIQRKTLISSGIWFWQPKIEFFLMDEDEPLKPPLTKVQGIQGVRVTPRRRPNPWLREPSGRWTIIFPAKYVYQFWDSQNPGKIWENCRIICSKIVDLGASDTHPKSDGYWPKDRTLVLQKADMVPNKK